MIGKQPFYGLFFVGAGDGIYFATVIILFAVTHCVYSVVGLCFELWAGFLRSIFISLAIEGRKRPSFV